MDKNLILEKYKSYEDKLLISKLFDKIEMSNKSNKVETTDFLNEVEQNLIQKVLYLVGFQNYRFFGGYDGSTRKVVVIFPEKMKEIFEKECFKYDTIFSVFRIEIPRETNLNYNHSVYLGGIIKLGIRREKIGDILIDENGNADIILKKETEKYLFSSFKQLNRFRDASISNIKLQDLIKVEPKFETCKIITSSLRLDNIVSELAKTSRNKALEIIEQERVFLNYVSESKNTKQVKESDTITIRGKGKFIIDEIVGNTKKGNYIIMVRKYI